MKIALAGKFFAFMSSPRLTLGVLIYGALLVFVGTLAQTQMGIMAAQREFFESWVCLAKFGWLKIPMFGGATVGTLAFLNLIFAGIRFARSGLAGFGISITHMALALLILSGGIQYFVRVEGKLSIREGESTNVVFITDQNSPTGTRMATLPFSIRLKDFKEEKWAGSNIAKSYSSELVFEQGTTNVDSVVKMNSPASFGGWTFYQMSYGEGGKVSVLSAVRNHARMLPWVSISAVAIGMLMIFLPRAFGAKKRL